MERIHKAKVTVVKSLQKLSQELTTKKLKTQKPKNSSYLLNRTSKIPNPVVHSSLIDLHIKSKKSNLEPLSGDKHRAARKAPIRSKRNLSLEDNYEEQGQSTRTLKRNSSLIENYHTEEVWDKEKVPYTPAIVLKKFSKHLTIFEQGEILTHRCIYYIAPGVVKLDADLREKNYGFDSDRNDLVLIKSDHISYRYEVLEIIGRGSYGQVIKAFDHKERKLIAIKIIRNLPCIVQQAKIETQVLYRLIQQGDPCPYLIKILDNTVFRNHIIQTFELLDMNLYQHLKVNNFAPISFADIKIFTQQLLEGMRYYHSLKIIHCDLKPENLMISPEKKKITIIDFGSACFHHRRIFTYIQSRYYRAPEVILELGYDEKIDIWSLGCVLLEMRTGKVAFKGKDEYDQILAIMEVLGPPPLSMLENSSKRQFILEMLKKNNNASPSKARVLGSKSLKEKIGDAAFLNFLNSKRYLECLEWNPCERLSAEELLEHEWLHKEPIIKHPSLSELKWEKIITPSSPSKKKILDYTSTQRVQKKKSLLSNF